MGWGVGGIEAEAAMLGQPVYFLTPDVVGVHLTGALRAGVTATDLVLRVTELLRKAKVVGKFVEFHGEGAASLPVPERATLANMAPEYGATIGFFPRRRADAAATSHATGRSDEQVEAVRAYYQAQGLFGMPGARASATTPRCIDLDLADGRAGGGRARSGRRTGSRSARAQGPVPALLSSPGRATGGPTPDLRQRRGAASPARRRPSAPGRRRCRTESHVPDATRERTPARSPSRR